MNEAKQNRDRNGGVTNESQAKTRAPNASCGVNFLSFRPSDWKTRGAMGEMKGKQEQADDVKAET
jgi:hypothetical protein